MSKWKVGDRVKVTLPGAKGPEVLAGTIDRIAETGPFPVSPNRNHRIVFDDSLIFGGSGKAWFDPEALSEDQS